MRRLKARSAAAEIGCSESTLSRALGGSVGSVHLVRRIYAWSESLVTPNDLLGLHPPADGAGEIRMAETAQDSGKGPGRAAAGKGGGVSHGAQAKRRANGRHLEGVQ